MRKLKSFVDYFSKSFIIKPEQLFIEDSMDLGSLMNTTVYGFSFSEAVVLWRPLILFVIGVAIYSIFIFTFYRFLARKKIFELKIHEYDIHKGLKKFLYVVEYIILFPFVVFFWFLVMSLLITIVTSVQSIENILFISVAFVSAVRIGAYYNELLARDMAKLVPLALLALFLIDASFLSWENSLILINQLPSMWRTLVYYLFFVIFLELVLRLITLGKGKKPKAEKAPETPQQPAAASV